MASNTIIQAEPTSLEQNMMSESDSRQLHENIRMIKSLGLYNDRTDTQQHREARFTALTYSRIYSPFASNLGQGQSVEQAAQLYRTAANVSEPTHYSWNGRLPPTRLHPRPDYSPKVFVGGIPWDITGSGLWDAFRPFGPMRIEWPKMDGCHPRHPANGSEERVGYVYVHYKYDSSVRTLLRACEHDRRNGGEYYCNVSSRGYPFKTVQVIPWVLNDSVYVKHPLCQPLDPQNTIFVGALHGMMNAEDLAHVLTELFGDVLYASIDMDKNMYPIGSARVTFNSHKSYVMAVTAAFVQIKTPKFRKKIQIDPHVEEEVLCYVCGNQPGPYFCRDFACFCHFCRGCWDTHHASEKTRPHTPLLRNLQSPIRDRGNVTGEDEVVVRGSSSSP